MAFKSCRIRKDRRGFTLIELLVAITLLGLVLAIISGGFHLAVKSFKTGEHKAAALERNRSSMKIIISQIQSFMPLTFLEDNGNRSFHFRGGRDSLRIATGYSAWNGGRCTVIVEYRTEKDENGRLRLLSKEFSDVSGAREDLKLFDDLSDLRFEYFRKEAGEEKGQWEEEWQDSTAVPEKIRLSMVLGKDRFSFVIPVRARDALNIRPGVSRLQG